MIFRPSQGDEDEVSQIVQARILTRFVSYCRDGHCACAVQEKYLAGSVKCSGPGLEALSYAGQALSYYVSCI